MNDGRVKQAGRAMTESYLRKNIDVLLDFRRTNPVKYRTLRRYLYCQDIYARELEAGKGHREAWQAAADHWNKWANALLEKRKKLEKSGQWPFKESLLGFQIRKNATTRQWLDEAVADFSRLALIEHKKRPVGKIDEDKKSADSRDIKSVLCATLSFASFNFPGKAEFGDTQFHGVAWFKRAQFHGDVGFQDAQYHRDTLFGEAQFHGDALFVSVQFHGRAWFGHAQFHGEAKFLGAQFCGLVWFGDAQFHDNAWFHFTTFERPVRFDSTCFRGEADFSAIQSKRSFSLHGARFEKVPDFNEASFHEPPVLDDMAIKDQLTEKGHLFRSVERPEENAKTISRNFRKLGKMAHEGRDWLNEMEFFAQEIRTRRFGLDFPVGEFRWLRAFFAGVVHPGQGKGVWTALSRKTPDILRKRLRKAALALRNIPYSGANPGRFWFGLFYEKFSNFGRSFVRPLVLLALSTLLFALLYYYGLAETKEATFTSALVLSFRQSLVISGLLRYEHYSELLKSLFGAHLGNWAFLWLNVQTIWSAFLWFLFFLALRNHFRIR